MANWIIVSAANASRVTLWLSKFDAIRGFPCCACDVAENPACTCDKHRRPDGSPAPHVGSRTLRHTVAIMHPTDGRLAIRVDPWITWLRAHPEAIGNRLTQTQINTLYAAIDGAVSDLPSDWLPVTVPIY